MGQRGTITLIEAVMEAVLSSDPELPLDCRAQLSILIFRRSLSTDINWHMQHTPKVDS